MPRICWHTIFTCWTPQVVRQAVETAWISASLGGHSSSYWCQQGQVPETPIATLGRFGAFGLRFCGREIVTDSRHSAGTVNLAWLGSKGASGAATLDLSIQALANRLAARATGTMCDRVEGLPPE